jgi:hypothetical protein
VTPDALAQSQVLVTDAAIPIMVPKGWSTDELVLDAGQTKSRVRACPINVTHPNRRPARFIQ